MSYTPEIRALLTLRLVPGIGPRLTAALLEQFGSAPAVLRASPAELAKVPHIGEKTAHDIHAAFTEVDVDKELVRVGQAGVTLLGLGCPGYPESLSTIYDPPTLLYLRGTLEARDAKAVALVGSRQCTSYGRRLAERLATGLAAAGYTIVSGLARGIDGAAHRAALQAGGRTIAVLANGLSRIYPPEHKDLAREVAAAGAVVSEATMDTGPLAHLFPGRNRVISGLSRGVVIVEAAEKSGALLTATHAADQSRTVMAVPGPVDSPTSGGCNELLRKGGILVRGVDDVLEELEGVAAVTQPAVVTPEPPPMDDLQRRIWDTLDGQPRHLDELVQQLGLTVPQATGSLLTMELKRIVRRLPGNRYERY